MIPAAIECGGYLLIQFGVVLQSTNVFYLASFQISPIISQVCASHILLNIHGVTELSDDTNIHSSGPQPSVPRVGGRNLDYNEHALSFQMGPLSSRKRPSTHDVLDFDVDVDHARSIVNLSNPRTEVSWNIESPISPAHKTYM